MTVVSTAAPAQAALPGTTQCGTSRQGWLPVGAPIGAGLPGVTNAASVRFAEIDGDGREDLVLLDEIGSVRAWLNRGTDAGGGWLYRQKILFGTGAGPDRVRFADIDRDGKDDYLVVRDGGAVDGWLNRGGDITTPEGTVSGWQAVGQLAGGTGVPADQVQFADIDGDGDDDYVTASGTGPVDGWRNDGADIGGRAGWVHWGTIAGGVPSMPAGTRLVWADLNCDGKDDYLALKPDSAIAGWVNRGGDNIPGGAGWEGWGTVAAGASTTSLNVLLGDVNGDRGADYVVLNPDGALVGYLNNGGDTA